ncbi:MULTISPECIES: DEAD/DEAH box helicase [unclassified Bacillus (in: firmicutes)]|uniref:DEAD/DEAH box helicase n=1 Tax=unclassified Bacillus (in: firmicutes) TaxID=185979 RepID=UPI0008E7EA19|nr:MULTISPECIES: DEAD/DEAH box helicase [unclassified Bacillus (in: firmicutes)]SFB25351.1 competence protein ComFA [Bacillus sp. UNCCL13]SFQ91716.1 competence protein ComFA [Bacillus sp. cl95]
MRFFQNENHLTISREPGSLRILDLKHIPQPQPNPNYDFDKNLQNLLKGKQLLHDDLPYKPDIIHEHYENGLVTYRAGILRNGKKEVCARCGNAEARWFAKFPCYRCGETCTYCRKCLMMGRVTDCTPLLGWQENKGNEPTSENHLLAWAGTLSPGQQTASINVIDAIRQNDELLVWAVCGAGKTEILFKGIEVALMQHKRVCIATPRTDVVLELTPRLQAAFPHTPIASLYGGSPDRHTYAPLTIATTHQLLRFYQAFDTIILDEVDAFPYTVEEALQYAVKQARKPQSAMIYLTATPNTKWQRECQQGKRNFVTIPARFHRHPLPVPQNTWCGNWQKPLQKGKLPNNILRWTKQRLDTNKQALIFFPHIALMEKALPILQKHHPNIESVHAEDPNRKEKVQAMRKKETLILLTTTILERGVTFANIDVAVVGAEDDVFTESALVQIAGRAGRSPQYPDGNVTFFHYGKTNAMEKAKRQILKMNREALTKGLVDA